MPLKCPSPKLCRGDHGDELETWRVGRYVLAFPVRERVRGPAGRSQHLEITAAWQGRLLQGRVADVHRGTTRQETICGSAAQYLPGRMT